MTIEPGREWGEEARVPHELVVASDESSLARAVTEHLRAGSQQRLAVALLRGDLLTALGVGVGDRVIPPRVGDACRLLPCDAYELTIQHGRQSTTTIAVSSVVIGGVFRPEWWLSSGGFLRQLNILPNSHPNDGRADALVWSTGNTRTVLAIRRRMRLGDHLPHPCLSVTRGSVVQWQAKGSARRIAVDQRAYGRASAVTVKVRPDAFWLVVAAT